MAWPTRGCLGSIIRVRSMGGPESYGRGRIHGKHESGCVDTSQTRQHGRRRNQGMLKISQKTEYALRAMIQLAQRSEEGLMSAREISEDQRIPLRFLEQQLGALSKAGLVESFRGAGGGCRLAKDPAQISVADVVDAIEGPFYPMFCLDPG